MRIAIGSDHRGHHVKAKLLQVLERLGHNVIVEGDDSPSIDYPDVAFAVGRRVSDGEVDRGILICGTGIGMAIAANKFKGVRAAAVYDEMLAEVSRSHNNTNVLCLPADLLGERNLDRLINVWLNTEFEGGRHARRVGKIIDAEGGR
jgi:ribose 5-phosphate isomerase B